MKKLLVNLLKLGISAAILTYVVRKTLDNPKFSQIQDGPKDWAMLGAAWACTMCAVCLSFIRWYMLVRALDLPFRLKDAFRLGFLGYLFNFVSIGSVGGDLFKAVFVAREQHGRRSEAVASVIIDRLVGMYSLFLVATVGVLLSGLHQEQTPIIEGICQATLLATGICTGIVLMLLIPHVTSRAVADSLRRVAVIGGLLGSLVDAIRMYRGRRRVLLYGCLISLATHVLFTLTLFMIAGAFGWPHPSLSEHFVIVPISMTAAGLPLPFGALGVFESALGALYEVSGYKEDDGIVVAFGYRLVTIAIAMVGACFYVTSRREVAAVLQEAGAEQSALSEPPRLDAVKTVEPAGNG